MELKVNEELFNCSDEELVSLSQKNCTDALTDLLARYKNLVKSRCNYYFLPGADREDLLQEGFIGLYKAIRDYKSKKNISFRSFADLCVKRQIITAVKTATRQKHIPLNSFISYSKPLTDGSPKTIIDIIPGKDSLNPELQFVFKEQICEIEQRVNFILSKLEYSVLMLYLDGKTYAGIANALGISFKSVTNTMYRLQKKLKKLKFSENI
ncbi:MAG: RNA polymerase sporulation sigma factor SigH [Syntrophomonadaceae bacterium]|nr:RNA polymerase sporulation sigma factor SigH [Syntrophomonadaceae bacterium]